MDKKFFLKGRFYFSVVMVLAFLGLIVFEGMANAETEEMRGNEQGLAIAKEREKRAKGFVDFTGDMEMILKNRHGEISTRQMRTKTLEVKGDGDKALSIFDTPRDVKGTAFLTFSHKSGDDDQWLYLPALKRVKRISSSNKSGSFMGSEFAYEDIASQEVEKYDYKYLRQEPCGKNECFVTEEYPLHPKSGYKRMIVWTDKTEYMIRKVDYYDRKNTHLKTLTFKGYEKYVNKFWRADEMEMTNHRTGKSTKILWKEYKFNTGLTDKDFRRNALKRAK